MTSWKSQCHAGLRSNAPGVIHNSCGATGTPWVGRLTAELPYVDGMLVTLPGAHRSGELTARAVSKLNDCRSEFQ